VAMQRIGALLAFRRDSRQAGQRLTRTRRDRKALLIYTTSARCDFCRAVATSETIDLDALRAFRKMLFARQRIGEPLCCASDVPIEACNCDRIRETQSPIPKPALSSADADCSADCYILLTFRECSGGTSAMSWREFCAAQFCFAANTDNTSFAAVLREETYGAGNRICRCETRGPRSQYSVCPREVFSGCDRVPPDSLTSGTRQIIIHNAKVGLVHNL
jgi:hypothetical protein